MSAFPWPSAAAPSLRAAVQSYSDELSDLCTALVALVAPGLAARRAAAVVGRGDPSVFDLFEYPGESRLTAAIPMDNPHCSCKLTRVMAYSCNPGG